MSDTLERCCREGIHWFPQVTVEKYSQDQTAYAERRFAEQLSWQRRPLVTRFGLDRLLGRPAAVPRIHGDWLRDLFPAGPEDGYARDEGNILVNNGLTTLVYLLFGATASGGFGQGLMSGGSGTNLVTAATQHTGIGVGATATAAAVTDTALGANGASAWYQSMDATFPSWQGSGTPGQINGQVTVASGNGNFAWNEWCWFTSTTAIGSWTASATLASVGTNTNMLNHKVPASSLGTKASGASWVFSNTVTFSLSPSFSKDAASRLVSFAKTFLYTLGMGVIRPGKYPQLADEAWLREQYERQGKSSVEVAQLVGCTPSNVQLRLKQFGIKARGRHYGHWNDKACTRCGGPFTPSGPAQKFCSNRCRYGELACEQCGEKFVAVPEQTTNKNVTYKRKFCSDWCRRAWQEENRAGRYVVNGGYVQIPNPTMVRRLNAGGYVELQIGEVGNKNGGRVLEHRWVMEQRIGRRLRSDEEVHHRNGAREDNDRFCRECGTELSFTLDEDQLLRCACGWTARPNLEIWLGSQPKGQRWEDLLRHALDVGLRSDPGAADALLAEYGFIPSGTVIELPALLA